MSLHTDIIQFYFPSRSEFSSDFIQSFSHCATLISKELKLVSSVATFRRWKTARMRYDGLKYNFHKIWQLAQLLLLYLNLNREHENKCKYITIISLQFSPILHSAKSAFRWKAITKMMMRKKKKKKKYRSKL